MKATAPVVLMIALGVGALFCQPAAAVTVLNFDDVSTTSSYVQIPDGYGGFRWDQDFYVINRAYHPGSGYDLGCVTPQYVAFNGYGYPVEMVITSAQQFDFNGAYLAAAWSSSLPVVVDGYLDGAKKYGKTVSVTNTGPAWCQFDYLGVDELRFSSSGTQFVMDNFTFNAETVIPEPLTLLAVGSAFAGIAGYIRRRRLA
jgi:hypothetical protein